MSHGSYVAFGYQSHSSQMSQMLQMSSEGRWETLELGAGHECLEQSTCDIWACDPEKTLPAASHPFDHLFADLQICPTAIPAHSRRTTSSTGHFAHRTAPVKVHKPQTCPSTVTQALPVVRYVNTYNRSASQAIFPFSPCYLEARCLPVFNPPICGFSKR